MGNTDKLAEFRSEAGRLGITVEPPSINRSGVDFDVAGSTIRYALAALKGVGRAAVETDRGGARPRRSRISAISPVASIRARINKRVLESLAAAGAFDELERERARATAAVDIVLATAQRAQDAAASGQSELFGGPAAPEPIKLPDVAGWLPAERLQREYDAVGFFLTGHPLDDYAGVLKSMQVQSWAAFSRAVKAGVTAGKVAATVVSRAERRTKTGNKMGIIGLSDPVRPIRSRHLRRRPAAIPRPAGARQPGAALHDGGSPGRRGARPHPDRRGRSIAPPPRSRRACASSCATKPRSTRWPSASTRATGEARGASAPARAAGKAALTARARSTSW